MPCTALFLFEQLHGTNTEFLSKAAIIDFAEVFARKFYAQKLIEAQTPFNDSYVEQRKKYPPSNSPIQDIP